MHMLIADQAFDLTAIIKPDTGKEKE